MNSSKVLTKKTSTRKITYSYSALATTVACKSGVLRIWCLHRIGF